MNDELSESVKGLLQTHFRPFRYHSDGKGHVQVEQLLDYKCERLTLLIDAIESSGERQACFSALSSADPHWLCEFSKYLENNKAVHTLYQLELLDILADDKVRFCEVLKGIMGWFWSESNWRGLLELSEIVESEYLQAIAERDTHSTWFTESRASDLHYIKRHINLLVGLWEQKVRSSN